MISNVAKLEPTLYCMCVKFAYVVNKLGIYRNNVKFPLAGNPLLLMKCSYQISLFCHRLIANSGIKE